MFTIRQLIVSSTDGTNIEEVIDGWDLTDDEGNPSKYATEIDAEKAVKDMWKTDVECLGEGFYRFESAKPDPTGLMTMFIIEEP